ncbi:unnamed protein product [Arctia plantaginis]|uniref:PHD-type domain-containing protein n=1 Tax=Arctia plantaginis TaxID=874455 RepID=A0A8S1ABK2_ARCPL|nr:unnamed protein product [Arctia plantaginis]
MSTKSCGGCMNDIRTRECLKCYKCQSWFDFLVVPEKRFKSMGPESRINWNCPGCRSTEPKLDNTNTPIRATQASSPIDTHKQTSLCSSNVTKRNKKQQGEASNLSSDDTVMEITGRALREIVRQEIESAIGVLVTEQFKKINDLVTSFQQSLTFFNEQYENMKAILEDRSTKILQLEKENSTLTPVCAEGFPYTWY